MQMDHGGGKDPENSRCLYKTFNFSDDSTIINTISGKGRFAGKIWNIFQNEKCGDFPLKFAAGF